MISRMKIQCSVCEAAEAKVFCCADEAALCRGCDQKVHAANKLASKHQKVLLSSSSSQMPKCDICQEIVGYFFCLQDRALLCRKCDAAIHSTDALVSLHQRFLLTGVKVGLEATESWPSDDKISGPESCSVPKSTGPMSSSVVGSDLPLSKLSFAGGPGAVQWPLDGFLRIDEFNQNGLSKVNNKKAEPLATILATVSQNPPSLAFSNFFFYNRRKLRDVVHKIIAILTTVLMRGVIGDDFMLPVTKFATVSQINYLKQAYINQMSAGLAAV